MLQWQSIFLHCNKNRKPASDGIMKALWKIYAQYAKKYIKAEMVWECQSKSSNWMGMQSIYS